MASFISELQKTFQEAPCTIKALLLSNPHNPLGRCFSREELEACLRFCEQKNIHLISDEVFGLMNFESFDVPSTEEFVSVLSLDVQSLGCDLSRVHTIWSPSKVFALSGLRLVSLTWLYSVDCKSSSSALTGILGLYCNSSKQ